MRDEMMASMLETLERHLSTETIIGKPVNVGEITLIPVMDAMFGYGGGAGEGLDEKKASGSGSGGGAGARLSAKAIVVIRGGEVQVLPLAKGGALDKILEAVPGLVEKFTEKKAEDPDPNPDAE